MNTTKNKQLLWKLLYDKHYFKKFENNQFDKIKKLFDKLIIEIDTTTTGTILEKNKKFIQQFIVELNRINKINTAYKREDLIDTRQQELLNNFHKKTEELNNFKPNKPSEIDFSDTIEETPINLLNSVSELNLERDKDISILQKILTNIETINKNQEHILELLKNKTTDNSRPKSNNLIEKHDYDLINMNINE
tara:strand:- start:1069 stop:1647 length:579 start_codon:yes stop_codon:yes gene_type:complete